MNLGTRTFRSIRVAFRIYPSNIPSSELLPSQILVLAGIYIWHCIVDRSEIMCFHVVSMIISLPSPRGTFILQVTSCLPVKVTSEYVHPLGYGREPINTTTELRPHFAPTRNNTE